MIIRQVTKKRAAPDPDAPCAENTPGVLMEHFDLSTPFEDGEEPIIYRSLFEVAKEAAASAGWAFRSYSSRETPGSDADYIKRIIRHYPTLILYRDGVELGRHTSVANSVAGILFWGNTLLGIECEEPARPPIPDCFRDKFHITPDGLLLRNEESAIQAPSAPEFKHPNATKTMNDDSEPDLTALREEIERHFVSGTPLEIIYFGGGLPGAGRLLTPLHYCENRGRNYIIALCHRSGIEKTFRLDRMHLPGPPLADGTNDFRVLAGCLGNSSLIEGMLSQIAGLGNLPMENALAAHLAQGGEFESFFDEYYYGCYTLGLKITSAVIYLSLGYEANDCDMMHYEFTPESEPRLTPGIATHYALYTGRPATRRCHCPDEAHAMKTIKITLEKEGAQATCTHVFRNDDFPLQTTWAGNKEAFQAPDGRVPSFRDGIDDLPETVAFQANLCGATYKIEDLGGEAVRWMDEVEGPSPVSNLEFRI